MFLQTADMFEYLNPDSFNSTESDHSLIKLPSKSY